jgi:hypothetical protein
MIEITTSASTRVNALILAVARPLRQRESVRPAELGSQREGESPNEPVRREVARQFQLSRSAALPSWLVNSGQFMSIQPPFSGLAYLFQRLAMLSCRPLAL